MKPLPSMTIPKSLFLKNKNKLLLLLITLFGLSVRLYRLDSLPAEMWGDVIEHYKLTQRVLNGGIFFHYDFGGDGPLFTYFSALVASVFGLSFFSLKLTSALISTAIIPAVFILTHNLKLKFKTLPYIVSFLIAVSFWNLSFSHQAKSYILVPLLAALALYSIFSKKRLLAGFFLGLGMYSQAAFWGIFLLAFTHVRTLIIALIISLPFWFTVYNGTTPLSRHSYIGEKFAQSALPQRLTGIINNVAITYRSLFFQGDATFRHNIPHRPHLDRIMQGLFVIGITSYISSKRRSLLFIVSLFIFPLASFFDVTNLEKYANFGRTIGLIIPTHILAALGLCVLVARIKHKYLKFSFITIVLVIISVINLNDFFNIYPNTLPNQNISFTNAIVETLHQHSAQIKNITYIHCCWGDYGQPEPYATAFALNPVPEIEVIIDSEFLNYPLLVDSSTQWLIVNPGDNRVQQAVEVNFPQAKKISAHAESYHAAVLYQLLP